MASLSHPTSTGTRLLVILLKHAVHLVELVQGVLSHPGSLFIGIALIRQAYPAKFIEGLVVILIEVNCAYGRDSDLVNLLDPLNRILLLGLETLVDLLEHLVLDLVVESVLSSGFRDGTRGQIQVNLVDNLGQVALHKSDNNRLS